MYICITIPLEKVRSQIYNDITEEGTKVRLGGELNECLKIHHTSLASVEMGDPNLPLLWL